MWANYTQKRRVWRLAKLASFQKRKSWRFFDLWKQVKEQTDENICVLQMQRKIREREREKKPSFYFNLCGAVLDVWKKNFLARRKLKITLGTWAIEVEKFFAILEDKIAGAWTLLFAQCHIALP